MKYDFTSIIERKGQDAIAIDLPSNQLGDYSCIDLKEGFDIIPMWVADMNFPVVPSIQQEIINRTKQPHFGYFAPRDEYYDAIIRWQKEHNHADLLERKHIGYENGVLGGVVSAMNVLASKGDSVLVHSPTYIGFTFCLENNGYNIVHSPLRQNESGRWEMDYEDMEKKIIENHIHTAIICNPHNPSGRIFTKEELQKAMDIFERHSVYVIADEIWSDLVLNGNTHVPVQSVSDYAREHTIAFYAPSKTFNLAGLIGAYHIVYNDWLRERLDKEESLSHYNSMNVLSMYALIGAYSEEGNEWLKELRTVLSDNVNTAIRIVSEELNGVAVTQPEGTYMLFIDCEEYCRSHDISLEALLHKGWDYGVIWQDGRPFGGKYTIRLNLALPHQRVLEAFDRLKKYVF